VPSASEQPQSFLAGEGIEPWLQGRVGVAAVEIAGKGMNGKGQHRQQNHQRRHWALLDMNLPRRLPLPRWSLMLRNVADFPPSNASMCRKFLIGVPRSGAIRRYVLGDT
jgi:hypothetical protein